MIARLLALSLLSASLLAPTLAAQTIQVNKENKTIAITATDSAEMLADTAEVTIGFSSYGSEQEQTYADATRTSNRIIDALIAAGLGRDQIRSIDQSLRAVDPQDAPRYATGQRFFFYQTWNITTRASDAARILQMAITSGANSSGGIRWLLADANGLESRAAEKALQHARQIAERMAAGLHAKLGALVYASNQVPERNLGYGVAYGNGTIAQMPNLKPLAIVPDKVTRSATVYAVFAIE